MQGTTRSIIGSIIIILLVVAIVVFTSEDEGIQNSTVTSTRQVNTVNQQMPIDAQQNVQAGDGQTGEKMIPQFAIDACVDLSEGDTCTMSSPRGEESGVCALEDGDTLACKPERLN